MAQILGVPAETITPGKMTYDLRRLRMHGLIERVPGTFRCQVTGDGITRALFLTLLHDKFLRTGLAALAAPPGKDRSLTAASRAYTAAIDDLARKACLAADQANHQPTIRPENSRTRLRIKDPGHPSFLVIRGSADACFTMAVKAAHGPGLNSSRGPPGSWESLTATVSGAGLAIWTQLPLAPL